MSCPDLGQPPAKKRRFFAEESPVEDRSLYPEPAFPDEINALTETSSNARTHTAGHLYVHPLGDVPSSQPEIAGRDHGAAATTKSMVGLDRELFESFVGEAVPPETLMRLRELAGNNMERAINIYLDGSWTQSVSSRPSTGTSQPTLGVTNTESMQTKSPLASAEKRARSPINGISQLGIMPNHRYIGAFGVGAWATRSGMNLIRHGDAVRIERTKGKPAVKMARGGKRTQPARLAASQQRADIIVRFTNTKGEEVGRLPKESAAWVSTLLDQKICHIEGTCVLAPDKIRINDTIYLQLRCSLLKKTFDVGGLIKPSDNNRTTGIFEEKETSEEKDLRLRQVALVKLFDEINLHPSTVNETTATHKRQGLLQAAEIAEQYDREDSSKKTKAPETGSSTPSIDEEVEEGEELEQDQLDTLYKKAQSFDFSTPTREPANTFTMDLRKYQKQALHWMMSKELDEKFGSKELSMHPLWEEYAWPVKDMDDKELPGVVNQDSFYVNPYSGELSLDFPVQEQHCLGGILADGTSLKVLSIQLMLTELEMGLGKTIEMLSLMHTNRSDISIHNSDGAPSSVNSLPRLPKNSSTVESAPCTTLVVAPMSLLAQWESEAAKASKPGSLKTMVYYGSDKAANLQNLCCGTNAPSAPNLIITSYGVVLSEFTQVASRGGDRGSHGGLFSLDFFRVILDEAHFVKNRQSKTAKACYEIAAQHRWVLTGTPIVNRLEDLFSLVRFLRVEPWANFSFWKTFITVPFESKDFLRALDVVQTVLEPLVLRRTKDMKTPDGKALVPLPPRIIEIEELELSKAEREVYDYIYNRAKRAFNATMEAGTLLKSYTTIFAQILRLRQSCCHPVLTRNKVIAAEEDEAAAASDIANGLADDMDLQELIDRFTSDSAEQDIANKYGAHVLKQIQTEAGNECPICSEEPMVDPVVTGCWHSACKKCLLEYIEHQKDKHEVPRCFNCREPINQRDVFEIVHHDDNDNSHDNFFNNSNKSDSLYSTTPPETHPSSPPSRISLRRINNSNSSAKISALTTHLKTLRKTSPGTKSVVFSQFTSFLDLISPALARDNIPFLRFDGAMSQKQRAAVLTQFAESKKGIVLLLSLRAGGVGLNLTMAKRVFMMDPWWSFAVEAQAIDRVHRMGQEDEVKVVRFVCRESIEGRMLRIQERKKFM
ncbi:DNA helicase rad5 [Schaereria dolodes]|nr:DNA helicase rad5 [Schaereria dolodes]